MEVPCLGEPHPTHAKEPTTLIEKSRGPSRCEWFKQSSLRFDIFEETSLTNALYLQRSPQMSPPSEGRTDTTPTALRFTSTADQLPTSSQSSANHERTSRPYPDVLIILKHSRLEQPISPNS
ncbi:hypothetical protein Bbelb_153580 [Branchiostoma belcheri]|nr:hypothetical protein Bbelb_153580 [Branchiostoma belcheri]